MRPSRTAVHAIPARPLDDRSLLHRLAAPRRDDHVGIALDAPPRDRRCDPCRAPVAQLREDRLAAGDLDQLLDPADAGDQRVVPLLEEHARPPRRSRCARRRADRARGPRSSSLGERVAASSAQPDQPAEMRIICRISATLRWLNVKTGIAAPDQLARRCRPAGRRSRGPDPASSASILSKRALMNAETFGFCRASGGRTV